MHSTPTYPDFEVTVIHNTVGVQFVHATIEGRLCNVHFQEAAYIAGERKPRFPVPAPRLENNELNRAAIMAYRRKQWTRG